MVEIRALVLEAYLFHRDRSLQGFLFPVCAKLRIKDVYSASFLSGYFQRSTAQALACHVIVCAHSFFPFVFFSILSVSSSSMYVFFLYCSLYVLLNMGTSLDGIIALQIWYACIAVANKILSLSLSLSLPEPIFTRNTSNDAVPLSMRGLGHVTQFRNFGTSFITFERIELPASNWVQTQRTDPSCVWTIKPVMSQVHSVQVQVQVQVLRNSSSTSTSTSTSKIYMYKYKYKY